MQFNQTTTVSPCANTVDELCDEIEFHYMPRIVVATKNIDEYLQKNKQLQDVRASVAVLIQTIFYKLKREIEACILKERAEVFTRIKKNPKATSTELNIVIDSIKETHALILGVVHNLRQVMCDFAVQPHWNQEFRECIDNFYKLENNIHQWINIEEHLLFKNAPAYKAREKYSEVY